VLLHLVDGTGAHAGEAYKTVRTELEAYGEGLCQKPEIVALTKADAMTPEEIKQQIARLKRACKRTPLVVSAATGAGVPEVLRTLTAVIATARSVASDRPKEAAGWLP
jgi:GTP-binding protein